MGHNICAKGTRGWMDAMVLLMAWNSGNGTAWRDACMHELMGG